MPHLWVVRKEGDRAGGGAGLAGSGGSIVGGALLAEPNQSYRTSDPQG